MKRLTMLITSDGQWVLEDSVEFLTALGDPNPDYDAASFAVKNLGFIKFQVLDSSIVEIELHPGASASSGTWEICSRSGRASLLAGFALERKESRSKAGSLARLPASRASSSMSANRMQVVKYPPRVPRNERDF